MSRTARTKRGLTYLPRRMLTTPSPTRARYAIAAPAVLNLATVRYVVLPIWSTAGRVETVKCSVVIVLRDSAEGAVDLSTCFRIRGCDLI